LPRRCRAGWIFDERWFLKGDPTTVSLTPRFWARPPYACPTDPKTRTRRSNNFDPDLRDGKPVEGEGLTSRCVKPSSGDWNYDFAESDNQYRVRWFFPRRAEWPAVLSDEQSGCDSRLSETEPGLASRLENIETDACHRKRSENADRGHETNRGVDRSAPPPPPPHPFPCAQSGDTGSPDQQVLGWMEEHSPVWYRGDAKNHSAMKSALTNPLFGDSFFAACWFI